MARLRIEDRYVGSCPACGPENEKEGVLYRSVRDVSPAVEWLGEKRFLCNDHFAHFVESQRHEVVEVT